MINQNKVILEPEDPNFVPLPWEPTITTEMIVVAEKRAIEERPTKAEWIALTLALSFKLEEVMKAE